MQTLQKHGLERFDPSEKGERFDPNLHEATFQTKVEGKEDGTTFHTQQKGFTLNGRVIRVRSTAVQSCKMRVVANLLFTGCEGWRCEEFMSRLVWFLHCILL